MDEFEKIKTFSESLVERQQKITETPEKTEQELNLPQYLSQFRAVPTQEEKESRRLLWIVLALCLVIVAGAVFALTKRLPQMEETEIVVISPTPTPVKVLPENPGGLNIPDRDKVVYNRSAEMTPAPVVESLFPEPEQPVLPSEVIEPENKEEVTLVSNEEDIVMAPQEETEVVEMKMDETVLETEEPLPVKDEPTQETPVKDVVIEQPAVVQPVKIEKKKANGPIWRAQLLSSASKAKVESSWKQIAQKQKTLLSDMPYQIISATIPGKGTFWRLQVGEFNSKEQVVNLCAKLKKKKQDCIPVK